jgi:hypothetical protein
MDTFETYQSPSDVWLFPVLINLGFLLRENFLLCSSYLPLGVPNWTVKLYQHRAASPTVGTLGIGIMNSTAFSPLANNSLEVDKIQIPYGTVDFQPHQSNFT